MAQRMMRGFRVAWACVILAGCGGGGSVGSTGNPDSASAPAASPVSVGNVQFQPMDYEAFEGDDPIPALTITADVSGDFSKLQDRTVYVGVEDPDQLFGAAPSVSLAPNGLGIQLMLLTRSPNTKTGDFRSEIKVNVCMDSACRQQFAGSPFKVPYHVKILPGLKFVEQGNINLTAKFGSVPLPSWSTAVVLPAGATNLRGAVFKRGFKILSDAAEVKTEGATVTLQARPVHVTSRELDLYVEAEAVTSTGRKVMLSETRPITYKMTAPDQSAVVYTPASGRLVRSSTSVEVMGGIFQMMSPQAEPFYVSARVEYLDASNGGLDDAKGKAWLVPNGVNTANNASDLLFPTEVRYGLNELCMLSGPRCIAPGHYVAKVILTTATGQDAPQSFLVRLDMEP
jgi:hypothetical protein